MTGALPGVEPWALAAAALVAGALFAFTRGVAVALGGEHAHSRRRLDTIAAPAEEHAASVAAPASRRSRRSSSARGTRLLAEIRRAGLAWTTTDFLAMSLVSGVLCGVVSIGAIGASPVALPAGLAGCLLPLLLVRRRAAARSARFNAQVVDAIELIASSLRSGFGFMQSLDLAGREQPSPMCDELRQVTREVDLGASVDEALERLVARTRDEDLELVVQAVLVQRRVGGDLGDVLSRIAGMIRDRIRVRGEIHTLTAQARMSAWIVGALPMAIAAVTTLLQPSQMAVLFTEPIGRLLVGAALVMQVIGFILVRRVADISY